jgi:hypothetical protein
LLTEQYKEIGINFQVKRMTHNCGINAARHELQATVFWAHDQNGDNDRLMGNFGLFGRLWNTWFTSGGKEGVEPPACKRSTGSQQSPLGSSCRFRRILTLAAEGNAWQQQSSTDHDCGK